MIPGTGSETLDLVLQIGIALAAVVLILVLALRFRTVKKARPRIHLVLNMDNQQHYKTQQANPLFADGRAMRPRIEGTVARGHLDEDDVLHLGRDESGAFVDVMPLELSVPMLERGRDRFNIYCAPCHGYGGYGDGMVSIRADQLQEGTWVPPTSLHEKTVKERPLGHLYNTVKNGIRNMPGYASQIQVEDRWAIVAYVKALQRSQDTSIEDVPEGERASLR